MYIGRVSGTVVATIKNELFEGRKLLVVDRLDLEGRSTTKYDIAVDMVQAGVGGGAAPRPAPGAADEAGADRVALDVDQGPQIRRARLLPHPRHHLREEQRHHELALRLGEMGEEDLAAVREWLAEH